MNEVQIFTNEEFGSVRTVMVDDKPYLVGKDVAEILGYKNASKALQDHVDDEDKLNNKTLLSLELNIGQRGGWLINESGLYSLILSSKLESAKRFKHWVTSEVLPAIRKHGLYAADELLQDPDLFIKALQDYKKEREARLEAEKVIAVKDQQIAELKPKADYHDIILSCPDAVTTTTVAKDYGWSARRLNEYLHQKGVQYKQRDIWLLYQKYADKGYTHTETTTYLDYNGREHCAMQTCWTQKGRLFIYGLMMEDGNLPLVEAG